jgi:hypothetical protein
MNTPTPTNEYTYEINEYGNPINEYTYENDEYYQRRVSDSFMVCDGFIKKMNTAILYLHL